MTASPTVVHEELVSPVPASAGLTACLFILHRSDGTAWVHREVAAKGADMAQLAAKACANGRERYAERRSDLLARMALDRPLPPPEGPARERELAQARADFLTVKARLVRLRRLETIALGVAFAVVAACALLAACGFTLNVSLTR